MRRLSLVGLLLVALPAVAQERPLAQHPRVREAIRLLEVWADAQRAYQQVPGLSLAVVHDQELLWSAGLGLANRELGLRATPQTIYSICSISKLFTAIAVMQLRDRGKLRLDDSVSRHLAWFRIKDTYPEAPPITVEGLLTHSSGLPRESDFPYWTEPEFRFPTREEIRERVAAQDELFPAQEYFQYSNLGLTLAGEIVVAAAGQPYDRYVVDRILGPLRLSQTWPEIPAELHGTRMAVGYSALTREGTRTPLPVFQGRGVAPAMAFASTVEDLAALASWQFRVLHHGAGEVLGRNTLREMQRVHWTDPDWKTTWGLGFAVQRDGEKTLVGHGGSCPGYRSEILLQAEDRIAVAVAVNASGVNTGSIARRAHQILAPAVREAQDTTARPPAAYPTAATYAGSYSQSPWGGELAVLPWKSGLAMLSLPTEDPLDALVELKPSGEHRFRRVRKDGSLADEVRFELGPDGRATRLWQHSNYSKRMP